MALDALRKDCAVKQQRGLHIILASVIVWGLVLAVQLTGMPTLSKNLFTFMCTAPLLPLSFLISKMIGVDFQNKANPLSKLGLLFSVNQILYLLVAMWAYGAVPDKMLMVLTIIFGAHLMPYGWLYQSKVYYLLSVLIPIGALALGLLRGPVALAGAMLATEAAFSLALMAENRNLKTE